MNILILRNLCKTDVLGILMISCYLFATSIDGGSVRDKAMTAHGQTTPQRTHKIRGQHRRHHNKPQTLCRRFELYTQAQKCQDSLLDNMTSFLCDNPDVRTMLETTGRRGVGNDIDNNEVARFIHMNFLPIVDEAQFHMDETNGESLWRQRYLQAKSVCINENRWVSFLEDFDIFNDKLNTIQEDLRILKVVVDSHVCDQNNLELRYYDAFHTGFGPFVQKLKTDSNNTPKCSNDGW